MAHTSTTRLPNELLALIFGQFCLHCQDAYNESWDQRPLRPIESDRKLQQANAKPWYAIGRQALCSLSLTCRQFRDVAQSVLYHEFVLGYGDSWYSDAYQWEDRLAPFIRTLARRPDLARLVKVIHISHHTLSTSEDKEQSRRNILLEAATALGVNLPAAWKKRVEIRDSICLSDKFDWPDVYPIFSEFYLDDHPRMTEKQERQLRRAMTQKSMPGRRWMNAELVAMLLAHAPNIDIISIQSSPGWPTCGIAESSLPALGITHLPVKRLALGMLAGPIIKISGNLKTLNLQKYISDLGSAKIEMPCLKTLRIIDGFLSAERLSNVLEGCTGGLVSFEYEAGQNRRQINDRTPDDTMFQLSDAIDSLQRHKSTLQILHLDLSARHRNIRRARPGVNMRDFTALKHLWISILLLFPNPFPPKLGIPVNAAMATADAEILVEFLPRSIVSLEIHHDSRHLVSNALHGLLAVKSDKFPLLKVVCGPGGRGNLGQAFEAAGVKFSTSVHLCRAKTYLQGLNTDSRLEFPDWGSDD
ncbi:uncharacterized protein FTJAE_11885 [Fusarium tjaetaba]|uniref:F-box domain-containing protein n=1 Tax=Fusarium tjaetaba TaxID=1567544 RepID=A0A8H5QP61_9HYPO|nr:uncharacterized protein FTJAE_11885 [Fusarium tjaetaba]KAF5619601.1 hypothetical protein FTJAE_11885 [Fusarium tjaetaba]